MDAKQISKTFSKGSVVLSDNLIIVSFGSGVSQAIWCGEPQRVFESMITGCKAFRIHMSPEDGFRLIFEFDEQVSSGTIYYQPIEREKTLDEIKKAIQESRGEKVDVDFASFFKGVSLDDEAAVMSGFLDFLDAYDKAQDNGVSSLLAAKRWQLLSDESMSFRKKVRVFDDIEYMPPDRYSNGVGSITFSCFSKRPRTLVVTGAQKDSLVQMVRLSDGVDFDCWIAEDHGKEAVFQIIVGTERDR